MHSAVGPTLLLLAAVPVAVHAVGYARTAWRMRVARRGCPFEDDDHTPLSWPRATQLAVAEAALWWWVWLTAWQPAATGVGRAAESSPVLVLTPPHWPRAALRALVSRLRRDGVTVVCPRIAWRGAPDRVHALDRALRATWERCGARTVDVVAPAGTAAPLVRHLAAGGSGVPVVRRLVTVGAAGSDDPVVPPPTDVVAIYSLDDPWAGPGDRLRRRGALNVAMRGFGRLGLLHAPYVYAVIHEHLRAPVPAATPWTSAGS